MQEAANKCNAMPIQNAHSSSCMKSSMLTTPETTPSMNVPRRARHLTSQGTARLIPTPRIPSTKKKILTACADPKRSSAISGTAVTMMDRYRGSRVNRTKNDDLVGRLNARRSGRLVSRRFNLTGQ